MTELAVILASGDIALINVGPNKVVDEGTLPVLMDDGSIPAFRQGVHPVVDESTLVSLLGLGVIPNIKFDNSQALSESNIASVMLFNFLKKTNITNPGWVDVATTYPAVVGAPAPDQVEMRMQDVSPAGTYIVSISALFNLNEDKESALGRFSDDGGATWLDFSREPKDRDDAITLAYNFPYVHAVTGPFNFVWQMAREDNGEMGTLNVITTNMWFERKT